MFLVVAVVIAYDRWNSDPVSPPTHQEASSDAGSIEIEPSPDPLPRPAPPDDGRGLSVPFPPDFDEPVDPAPAPGPTPPIDERPPPRPGPEIVPPKPAPAPAPKETVHVVRSGESLEVIALHYYNTRAGVAWIAEANGIRDINRIMAKQKLVIPARKESVRAAGGEAAETGRTPRAVPNTYVVKSGEDLYDIARKFYGDKGEGARVNRIMQLNHLWSADVRAGTKLVLPSE